MLFQESLGYFIYCSFILRCVWQTPRNFWWSWQRISRLAAFSFLWIHARIVWFNNYFWTTFGCPIASYKLLSMNIDFMMASSLSITKNSSLQDKTRSTNCAWSLHVETSFWGNIRLSTLYPGYRKDNSLHLLYPSPCFYSGCFFKNHSLMATTFPLFLFAHQRWFFIACWNWQWYTWLNSS